MPNTKKRNSNKRYPNSISTHLSMFWKVLIVLAIVISASSLSYQLLNKPRLAFVNTAQVLEQYQGMQDASQAYEVKLQEWQTRTDTLRSEFERDVKIFEKEKESLSKNEKEKRLISLEKKRQDLQKYREFASQKAVEKETAMTEQVLKRLNSFMKEYGEKQGYTLILGANGQGSLLYAKEGMDITKEMIEIVNERYQKI